MTEVPEQDSRLTTHPEGSELIEEDDLNQPSEPGSTTSKVTSWALKVFLLVVVLGLIGAFLAYQNTMLTVIAAIVFIAMAFLFLAPVLLARGTKIAEDDDARRP